MGMDVLNTPQAKGTEPSAKQVNQGGSSVAAVSAQPEIKARTMPGAGTEESQAEENKEIQATQKQIQAAIEHVKRASKVSRTRCEFSYHEKVNRVSIKILDEDTNEVIKEIPPEESLKMVEKMWELAGILIDERM